jgi:(p)ppGpp synthase/HD superfamily hydrolase
MSTLEKAIAIACNAHKGKKDKAGASYILHPLRVMMRMDSPREMMAAVMHDVVEDSEEWTLQKLNDEGFDQEVINAIDTLTKRGEETYVEFITRVSHNAIGIKVKLADLEYNMNVMRLGNLTEKDIERRDKYHHAWKALRKDLQGD